MTENKKKRIARIGGISSSKESSNPPCDDRLMQSDHSLVYNIMESMDKAQNIMSYQQFQEFRSKDKPKSRTNNSTLNSSTKLNSNAIDSKQIKKIIPEKRYPLMAKCQKSMKYLKKNRCIPKPRAHVGFIPRPSINPVLSKELNNITNQSVSNTESHKETSRKAKKSKLERSPEINDTPKKAKISRAVDNSPDITTFQTAGYEHEPISTNNGDSGSDEFELFLRQHHSEPHARKKIKGAKRKKEKKRKRIKCAKKIAKVTSKTLSDSEESSRSDNERKTSTATKKPKTVEQFPPKRFQRIMESAYSDNNATDDFVNDCCTTNYDSSSSSDENLVNELNEESTSSFAELTKLNELPLSDLISKLKCKTCFVLLHRDPLLDQKAASLHSHSLTNAEHVSNSYDDDDCVIITDRNDIPSQNSESLIPCIEKNSRQECAEKLKSFSVTEELRSVNGVLNEGLISNSNGFRQQIDSESVYILCGDESMSEVLQEENEVKASAARKSLGDTEKDECVTLSKATRPSHTHEEKNKLIVNSTSQHTSDLPNNRTDVSLSCDVATSGTELFKVQILSVKSLNDESDIILLSDDEENDAKPVPSLSETKDSAAEDSDVEIICLDSNVVNKEECVNQNLKVTSETQNKVNELQENSSSQRIVQIDDDCIVLDVPIENTSTSKNITKVQASSQVVEIIDNEKTSLCKSETAFAVLDSAKDTILKTLGTIDFDCIKKVLRETSDIMVDNTQGKVENSFCDSAQSSIKTMHSFPEEPKQSRNVTCLSQNQASMYASGNTIVEVNVKINGSETSIASVGRSDKHHNLFQNSGVADNTSDSKNHPISVLTIKSSENTTNSSAVGASSCSEVIESKVIVSEKEFASNPKTEPDASLLSAKNQQLLPVYTKMEVESAFDELDILAAKSIRDMNETEKNTILPLIDLYKVEYERWMQIKCTEQNVAAGLKLLEKKQSKKLEAICDSIRNVATKDPCFEKVNEIEDDKVNIFNRSVVESASKTLNASGPSSSREVYNHLINSVCAECGKPAMLACSVCASIYYCSETCGMISWNKGHNAACAI